MPNLNLQKKNLIFEKDLNLDFSPVYKTKEDYYLYEKNYKCSHVSGSCTAKLKLCDEFVKDKDDCESLNTDKNNILIKKCVLEGTDCKAKSLTCEGFTYDQNSDAAANELACQSIISNDHLQCKYDSEQCTTVDKKCEDFDGKNDKWISHEFTIDTSKSNKKCIYKDNECLEVYKTCAIYNGITGTKTKTDCEIIFKNDQLYKCIYDEDNQCVLVEKECSEGTEDNCHLIKQYNQTHYCLFTKDNQCKEQFRTCEKYDKDVDKKTCESIIPYDTSKK